MGEKQTLIVAANFHTVIPPPTILRALCGSECPSGVKDEVEAKACTGEEEPNHKAAPASKV
jgi:hypothetical protein